MAVVCDVMMPGMNGVAFAGIVQGEFPQLPVLLISGYSDVRERLDASLRERVAILEKPFTAMALYAAIRRAVGLLEGRGPSAPSAGPSAPEPAERPER